MNLANRISIARIILVPFFIASIVYSRYTLALSIFIVCMASDALDGYIARAKGELLEKLHPTACAVLNSDNEWIRGLIPGCPCPVITVGTRSDADVQASQIEGGPDWLQFKVNGQWPVRIPVGGRHNVTNALCAVAVATHTGPSTRRERAHSGTAVHDSRTPVYDPR